MDADQIIKILKDGSPQQRKEFIQNCPENSFKNTALALLGSDSPGTIVVAITPLVMEYCNGRNPEFGAILAEAAHTFALEVFESSSDNVLIPTTLSNLACQHVNALNLLGRSEEVLNFVERYISYYESIEEHENLPILKVAKVSALINLNRIDEAEKIINDPKIEGNFAADIEIKRLRNRIATIKAKVTDTQSQAKHPQDLLSGEDFIGILKSTIGKGFNGDPQKGEELLSLVDKLDPQNRVNLKSPEGYQQMLNSLKLGEKFITKGGKEDSEWTIKQKVREASVIFTFGQQPSREKIQKSMVVLQECLKWAQENKHIELENDSLWGLHLCHSRLNKPSEAADMLLLMRKNMEETRAGIEDPLERGGVFALYPHLFDILCEKLQMAGRTEELLEAIEASKGRGVADILTKKAGKAIHDADIYTAVRQLPKLTKKYKFHYLTYYVDEDRTYIVLVSKDGRLHSIAPVEISKSAIREASLFVDPELWGEPREDKDGCFIENVSKSLSDLVKWLVDLLDEGTVSEGDHICYSADDNFNNVPLHYLEFKGKALIESFTISKIQNAFHLQQVLAKSPDVHLTEFLSFIVPTQQNVQSANWQKMKNSLSSPTRWLKNHLQEKGFFKDENGTISQIQQHDLSRKLIQFSTHGIFPIHEDAENSNPFYQSGLVLSDGKNLPDETAVSKGELAYVLTPAKIMELDLKLDHSHISLMACVSGLSREGLGGDALGMEWALIQAGATSILSSHWYVSAKLAATFFRSFYKHWLVENKSRAKSYCAAIKELRQKKNLMTHLSKWAAFSLTGDWR